MNWLELQPVFTIIFSVLGFVTACSSLAISYNSYKRDRGIVDVHIGVFEIRNSTSLAIEDTGIKITIVNSGRRPVILTSIGGYPKFYRLKELLRRISFGKVQWNAYAFLNEKTQVLIMDKGEYRTYTEGVSNYVFISFLSKLGKEFLEVLPNVGEIHVFDTTGRKHPTSRRIIKSLQKSLKKRT